MQDSQFINTIITKRFHCLFLSPHFDDVVLSCSTVLSQLIGKTDVSVVNIFTQAHEGKYTLSARKFLKGSKETNNAKHLFQQRSDEDKQALSFIKVNEVVNLNLTDALFRKKKQSTFLGKILPEFDHVYPTYKLHITGNVSSDDPAIQELKTKLEPFVKPQTIVFAPYGIGNHVDHQIVRTVAEELFEQVILYSDFPYNSRLNDYGNTDKYQQKVEFSVDIEKKTGLVKLYQTQFDGLFPMGKLPQHKEVFFLKKIS